MPLELKLVAASPRRRHSLERAAEIDRQLRTLAVARMLAAAEAKRQAGALEAALELASSRRTKSLGRSPASTARGWSGPGCPSLPNEGATLPGSSLAAAQHLEIHDPSRARETYLDAITAALFAGKLASRRPRPRRRQGRAGGAASGLDLPAHRTFCSKVSRSWSPRAPRPGTPVSKQALEAFRSETRRHRRASALVLVSWAYRGLHLGLRHLGCVHQSSSCRQRAAVGSLSLLPDDTRVRPRASSSSPGDYQRQNPSSSRQRPWRTQRTREPPGTPR